jgi:hypothetical protein
LERILSCRSPIVIGLASVYVLASQVLGLQVSRIKKGAKMSSENDQIDIAY